MILKKNRFVGPFALKKFLPRANNLKTSKFALKYQASNRSDWRAGVIVSKKVNKSAVVRNRIRRRFFEILRKNSDKFTSPHDLAFIVFTDETATMDASKLEALITDSLKNAKIMS
ncbi:MAG: ribonuclease P protein component [bacterium]|nr:ribonuclease P protein component [bacterium]